MEKEILKDANQVELNGENKDLAGDALKTEPVAKKQCPITQILKKFLRQFLVFYGIRALASIVGTLIYLKGQWKTISFLPLLFNTSNLRTGLFLSIMPALFKFLNLFFDNSKYFKSFNLDPKILTFISGTISSLIGVLIGEKANVMNFIILSVLVRALHSMIEVTLKEYNYPTKSRLSSWFALWVTCFGLLFLSFYHPSFTSITGVIDKYALFEGTEKQEMLRLRAIRGIDV